MDGDTGRNRGTPVRIDKEAGEVNLWGGSGVCDSFMDSRFEQQVSGTELR
jgi:hypothetical protein